jgi:hypothetical protein
MARAERSRYRSLDSSRTAPMDIVYAAPILVALAAALLCVRYLWRRRRRQLDAMRQSVTRTSRIDTRRGSERSEMRYGENPTAVSDDINARSKPFRRSTWPPVG